MTLMAFPPFISGEIPGQSICQGLVGNQTHQTAGWLSSEYSLWSHNYLDLSLTPLYLQVNVAKNLPKDKVLPICNLSVSLGGVNIESVQTSANRETYMLDWTIDTISYGVQDLVYTRVFAMIIVKENYNIKEENPFEVHAFVCDSR